MNARRSFLAGAALALFSAGRALAGGIDIELHCSQGRYAPDPDGLVTLVVGVRFDGCPEAIQLPVEPGQAGPALALERQDGEKWLPAEVAWVPPEAKEGDAKAPPAEPVRLERGKGLTFVRRARLAPGTYRLCFRAGEGGPSYLKWFHSAPFEVAPAASS